ncbi:sulfurtransferase [Corynebacterium sp. sy017]|uniref:sulfurtransferase n=1 Tax=unclassified Corynebacterium TaxID=2624378 RepID=UPI0011848F32|nr:MULTISPECIES: sulfurtransferase [unclassified Corynebacterium]MBP3088426.1 sulfurtransferase [Corynebacterium sp. sy017]TSD91737.1 sulfurtransferase [Corynebacterium sp. SY003]
MSITISAKELSERIQSGKKQTILAAMWYRNGRDGYSQFCSDHIPTALFCDTAAALSGLPSSENGRNPLPNLNLLNKWFSKWGISADRDIIVYDDHHGLFAARAWWIFKWVGLSRVFILDGGQKAWEALGEETLGGPGNLPGYREVLATGGHLPVATIEEVKAHTGLLIDAREPNRFAGRKEFLDLKAGHIPSAVNISTRSVLNADGTFKSAAQLQELFSQAGINTAADVDNAIIYSGSGNHSAQVIAAMNIAGLGTPRHYIGGWSQWSADPRNPVETGD